MTDWDDALDRMKERLREQNNDFISDATFLKWYNVGGRKFAAETQAIRDIVIVPIPVDGAGAMDAQLISDSGNLFTKTSLRGTDPKIEYYKISECLYIDNITLIDTTNSRHYVLATATQHEKNELNIWDTNKTTTLPEAWRSKVPEYFELWPRFTQSAFKLLVEYRRKWLDVVDSTQETVALDERWRDGPEEYVLWKLGLTLGLYDFASAAKVAYSEMVSKARGEWDKQSNQAPRLEYTG